MLRSFFVLLACCASLCLSKGISLRCGHNEEVQCTTSCPPEKTCKNRDIQFNCLDVVEECTNKCVCKEGYARNFLGDCISNEHCDQCKGKNEFFACDSACDNECSTLNKQNRTNCPIKNIMCNPGCYCDDGYARDANKNCIPQEKCLSSETPLKCAQNEETKCVGSCPPEKTCRNRHTGISCLAVVEPCQQKCVCKDGYFKNSLSSCISEEQCGPAQSCHGLNEEYTQCKTLCPPLRCISLVARFKCDANQPCKAGCQCKPGYLRQNEESPCLPICECNEMKNSTDCQ